MQRKKLNLCFKLSSSKIFVALLFLITLISLLVVADLLTKIWLRCFMACWVIVYATYLLWRQGFLNKQRSISMLSHINNHEWLLVTREGKEIRAILKAGSLVTPIVCVLCFRVMDQPFYHSCKNIIVFCDALPKDDFRRLRVALSYIT